MKSKLLAWLLGSSWFSKYAGWIGVAASVELIDGRYWRQIKATREAWGITNDSWEEALVAVIAASGVAASLGLTAMRQRKKNPFKGESK
jgi:hypothetical protein